MAGCEGSCAVDTSHAAKRIDGIASRSQSPEPRGSKRPRQVPRLGRGNCVGAPATFWLGLALLRTDAFFVHFGLVLTKDVADLVLDMAKANTGWGSSFGTARGPGAI